MLMARHLSQKLVFQKALLVLSCTSFLVSYGFLVTDIASEETEAGSYTLCVGSYPPLLVEVRLQEPTAACMFYMGQKSAPLGPQL